MLLRRSLALPLAAGVALAAAAPASAGYTLGVTPDAALPGRPLVGCAPAASCTITQSRLSNEEQVVRSEGGVVVEWRVHGVGGQVRLRLLGGGATAPVALPSDGAGGVAAATRIPVSGGDRLAFDLLDGARLSREPAAIPLGADFTATWFPALGDGELRPVDEQFEGYLYSMVRIEPDEDGDGFGDETQDPDHGQPPIVTPPGGGGGGGTPPGGGGGTPPGGGGGGGGTPPGGGGGGRAAELPAVPKRGPAPKLPASAGASARGVVALLLANPYRSALSGTVTLKQGRARVATTRATLPAGGSRALKLKLARGALTALRKRGSVRLTLAVALKAKGGKARTTTRALKVTLAGGGGGSRRAPGRGAAGFDGTYRASDGQTMVVSGGVVTSFNGDLTLYCTKAGTQKRVAYFMNGDDPDPKVAPDGSFAWEATSGYGFVKLKFDGRISGATAKGKLVVEDRSPLLGTGRFEFDYCYAGKEWTLRR
jgi:hypothetical protein